MEAAIIAAVGLVASAAAGAFAAIQARRALEQAKQASAAAVDVGADAETVAITTIRARRTDLETFAEPDADVQVSYEFAKRRTAEGRGQALTLTSTDKTELKAIIRAELEEDRKTRNTEARKAAKGAFLINFLLSVFFFGLGTGVTLLAS
jgi:hypothetical protein